MKQVEPSDPHSKRARRLRCHTKSPFAGPGHTLHSTAHKPTNGPLYLLCTAINATAIMASSFSIFNFPLTTMVILKTLPGLTLKACDASRQREPTALMSFCCNASFLLRSSNSRKAFYLSPSKGLVVIKSFHFKPSTSFRMEFVSEQQHFHVTVIIFFAAFLNL